MSKSRGAPPPPSSEVDEDLPLNENGVRNMRMNRARRAALGAAVTWRFSRSLLATDANCVQYTVQEKVPMRRHLKKSGKEAHADFELLDILGKGSFGSVYKVRGADISLGLFSKNLFFFFFFFSVF